MDLNEASPHIGASSTLFEPRMVKKLCCRSTLSRIDDESFAHKVLEERRPFSW